MGDNRRTIINQNVTSYNQSGGITAHTVNVDRRIKRTMTDDFRAGLLRGLPRDKPIQVMGMNGNTESMAFANEIHHFLQGQQFSDVERRCHLARVFRSASLYGQHQPGKWWSGVVDRGRTC